MNIDVLGAVLGGLIGAFSADLYRKIKEHIKKGFENGKPIKAN